MNAAAELAYKAAYTAGFRGDSLVRIVAIGGAESGFNPNAVGDQTLTNEKWGPSIGIWQIRSLNFPQNYSYPDNLRIASKLADPYYNARVAYALSQKGTKWTDWSVYLNGAYKNYEAIATEVAQKLGDLKKNMVGPSVFTCPHCNCHLSVQEITTI